VKYLLDTHALLWFDWGHPNLSRDAEKAMASSRNQLLVSTVSIWEIAINPDYSPEERASSKDATRRA
jgi:PIN domain nuclease of toxin-antitoxin system